MNRVGPHVKDRPTRRDPQVVQAERPWSIRRDKDFEPIVPNCGTQIALRTTEFGDAHRGPEPTTAHGADVESCIPAPPGRLLTK